MIRKTSADPRTRFPFIPMISSSAASWPEMVRGDERTPAWKDGPPLSTPIKTAPSTPYVRGIMSGPILIPRVGRWMRPWVMSSSTVLFTVSTGIAKPIPMKPPLLPKIAVLIPINLPCESSSGPPDDPGLIAASCWMTPKMGRPVRPDISRSSPLTSPDVRVWSRPNGYPMAYVDCPTATEGGISFGIGDTFSVTSSGSLITARSRSGSTPTSLASHNSP